MCSFSLSHAMAIPTWVMSFPMRVFLAFSDACSLAWICSALFGTVFHTFSPGQANSIPKYYIMEESVP